VLPLYSLLDGTVDSGGAESGAASVRGTSQGVAPSRNEKSTRSEIATINDELRNDATESENESMGDTGPEPVTPSVSCSFQYNSIGHENLGFSSIL
jgi:hypothetical protein